MAPDPTTVIAGTLTSSFDNIAGYFWVFYVFLAVVVIGGGFFLWAYWRRSKSSWDVLFRIRQEDNQYKKIYLDPTEVRGKRVTLSNGLRLIYLEKPILGKRLFPLLNYHTRPGVYDLVITSDHRIFIVTGIDGIDEQRKTLKVGIRYPGIDYSLEEVNRDHAALNKLDRRSDLLGIVKAASIAVIAVVILVMFIVGTQKFIEAKEIDSKISSSELQLFESMQEYQLTQNEQTNAMIILTEKLKNLLGTDDLRSSLNQAKSSG